MLSITQKVYKLKIVKLFIAGNSNTVKVMELVHYNIKSMLLFCVSFLCFVIINIALLSTLLQKQCNFTTPLLQWYFKIYTHYNNLSSYKLLFFTLSNRKKKCLLFCSYFSMHATSFSNSNI